MFELCIIDEIIYFSIGTGKSVLLREIIKCKGGFPSSRLGITASTGIAAVNIGGTTLHSWAGIGLGQESAKNLAGKFVGQPKFSRVLDRWRKVETLILDESAYSQSLLMEKKVLKVAVSMVDGTLFDKLVSKENKSMIVIIIPHIINAGGDRSKDEA